MYHGAGSRKGVSTETRLVVRHYLVRHLCFFQCQLALPSVKGGPRVPSNFLSIAPISTAFCLRCSAVTVPRTAEFASSTEELVLVHGVTAARYVGLAQRSGCRCLR